MSDEHSREFPELEHPRFGQAKSQAWITIVGGTALAVGGIIGAVVDRRAVWLVISVIGLAAVAFGVVLMRWMRRVESDPDARNPQDNAFNRWLLRLRRDHPVWYGLLSVAMFVLLGLTLWWKFTS